MPGGKPSGMFTWIAAHRPPLRPICVVTAAPQSPPWAPNRSYPSLPISVSHASATLPIPQPVCAGFPENP